MTFFLVICHRAFKLFPVWDNVINATINTEFLYSFKLVFSNWQLNLRKLTQGKVNEGSLGRANNMVRLIIKLTCMIL